MNLFAPKPDSASLAQVRQWTRELLALETGVVLTVNEVRCADEDCPDVETVIGVLHGPGRQQRWKVRAAAAAITREQLATVLASPATAG